MPKVTPNPPDAANTTSAHEHPKTETRNEANYYHHATIADIKATPRTPCTMFIVNPEAMFKTCWVSQAKRWPQPA